MYKTLSLIVALALGLTLVVLTSSRAAVALTPGDHAKQGVASSKYLPSDPSRLRELDASWAYDWSATPPGRTPGLQWVPMVWGAGSVTAQTIRTLSAVHRSDRAQYLLGFNEPDNSGQANMTPSQSAALWPQLERTGLKLGSPAPAVPTDGWLAKFMSIARRRHLRVNFIALHYYQDFTNPQAVAQLRTQLIALHRQVRRPIWITEIGALDIRNWGEPMMHPPTAARAVAYLRRLVAMLDRLAFVQRYAWFTDQCWTDPTCHDSSLFDGSGHVTALGRAYRSAP